MRRRIGYEGRNWVSYFWFVGWDCVSLGVHVCVSAPNIEIHLPFGFIRLGRKRAAVNAVVSIVADDDPDIIQVFKPSGGQPLRVSNLTVTCGGLSQNSRAK